MTLTGGKRKVNKSLKAWVAFVKKVQKEEKLSYKDAIHRAKVRKDKGEKWMTGGGDIEEFVEDQAVTSTMSGGRRRRKSMRGGEEVVDMEEDVDMEETDDGTEKAVGMGEADDGTEEAVGMMEEAGSYGGKRRRRTMRRSRGRGRSRGRTMRRGRGRSRGRSQRGGIIV